MTGRALLALALVVGCGGEDPAGRDYTAEACPTPLRPDPPGNGPEVCDRGRGYSPRFVTLQACLDELRLRPGADGFGLNSTSPLYLRCRPGVLVYTLDDVRAGQRLVAY